MLDSEEGQTNAPYSKALADPRGWGRIPFAASPTARKTLAACVLPQPLERLPAPLRGEGAQRPRGDEPPGPLASGSQGPGSKERSPALAEPRRRRQSRVGFGTVLPFSARFSFFFPGRLPRSSTSGKTPVLRKACYKSFSRLLWGWQGELSAQTSLRLCGGGVEESPRRRQSLPGRSPSRNTTFSAILLPSPGPRLSPRPLTRASE